MMHTKGRVKVSEQLMRTSTWKEIFSEARESTNLRLVFRLSKIICSRILHNTSIAYAVTSLAFNHLGAAPQKL